jgi:fatty acid desaturase
MKHYASYRLATAGLHHVLIPVSILRTVLALSGDWLLIIASAALSYKFSSSLAVYLFACLIIASRQHGLLVMMHEGAHEHLFPNAKWNDRITNIVTSWPFGISMEKYREHHLQHHQFTNTEQDPDWGRKVEHPQWQFPKSSLRFWQDFLPYLWGLGVRELSFAIFALGVRPRTSPGAYIFYGILLTGITLTHSWLPVLKFWFLPFFAVLPLLMKVRSISEHLGLTNKTELSASRNIIGSPIEAFFFGPHSNALHLVHHLYPQIPWFNLWTMRTALRLDKSFREGAHENHSYFYPHPLSTPRDLLSSRVAADTDSREKQKAA